jgi:5'-phosphate synthase pdxT subunit
MKRIGILALQGAFAEHKRVVESLGAKGYELRQEADLLRRNYDGIILPGGESTVIGKLLNELGMMTILKRMIADNMPVFGTCAGMILLAKEISNDDRRYLQAMDIRVRRNAYGRQLGSFHTVEYFQGLGNIPMTFIRAPYIESVKEAKGVEVLATVQGQIVAARQHNMLVTSFHPELTEDFMIHKLFLQM